MRWRKPSSEEHGPAQLRIGDFGLRKGKAKCLRPDGGTNFWSTSAGIVEAACAEDLHRLYPEQ